ncbi:hypothetical protein M885DRAFT_551544 [Pelagophyceae sp. CCMP2097]|nr:hypothetical protein M885DRAFT_551544 [Pelagophyceae sp. CCMP2097]
MHKSTSSTNDAQRRLPAGSIAKRRVFASPQAWTPQRPHEAEPATPATSTAWHKESPRRVRMPTRAAEARAVGMQRRVVRIPSGTPPTTGLASAALQRYLDSSQPPRAPTFEAFSDTEAEPRRSVPRPFSEAPVARFAAAPPAKKLVSFVQSQTRLCEAAIEEYDDSRRYRGDDDDDDAHCDMPTTREMLTARQRGGESASAPWSNVHRRDAHAPRPEDSHDDDDDYDDTDDDDAHVGCYDDARARPDPMPFSRAAPFSRTRLGARGLGALDELALAERDLDRAADCIALAHSAHSLDHPGAFDHADAAEHLLGRCPFRDVGAHNAVLGKVLGGNADVATPRRPGSAKSTVDFQRLVRDVATHLEHSSRVLADATLVLGSIDQEPPHESRHQRLFQRGGPRGSAPRRRPAHLPNTRVYH